MWSQDIVTHCLSRQQEMLPSDRIDGLVNSIGVTDRSEGRNLIAQTTHAAAHVVAVIRAEFAEAAKKIAETFSVRRPSAR